MKEPELKLFGMKIMLPEKSGIFDPAAGFGDKELAELKAERVYEEDQEAEEYYESPLKKDQNSGPPEESSTSSGSDDNPKTPSIDEAVATEDHTKNENDENDPRQKALKKPDKILPCPRCNSMDTKFCYYNNYNVNQPRHFCKSCQRYWTAGGTMRNVPVGAGRRKNKNSVPQYHHITISEALTGMDVQNGFHHQNFKPNGTVLSFGPDSPMCESINSGLNLAEKRDDSTSNGGKNDPQQPITPQNKNSVPVPSHVPFIPGVPWSFPWNPTIPVPAICPPGYPMPFYPPPYWNCGVPGAWNVPWIPVPSPVVNQQNLTGSNPNSPLGKHSRNGDLLSPNNPERKEQSNANQSESSIVVPKTLRFDDPEEAAKSSIWSTLGIKYDSISREGFFKSLQPKGDEKKGLATSSLMHANPAALSRSLNYQERV